ncbi:hypothetical protein NKG05_11215 [Oerskovia sp. M15]
MRSTDVPPGSAGMVDAAPDCSNVGVPNVVNQSLAWLKSSVKAGTGPGAVGP